ncbi:hypothetical protein N7513_000185 [Penicillium frequentans]|nr:hypothetical protein N7513_000185 [Penicillium glabrum]
MECRYCHEKFNRREHLDRHLRRHSGARPYPCPICSRAFSRQDTLTRHLMTHGADAEGLITRTRGTNACQSCSQDKVRCIGGIPCARCVNKSRQCLHRGRNKISTSLSYSDNSMIQNPVSSPDSPVVVTSPSNIDTIDEPLSVPELTSDSTSLGLNTNGLEGPMSNHAAFSDVRDFSMVALDMSADFPWTLEYTDFFLRVI